jgi:hypothetical protein
VVILGLVFRRYWVRISVGTPGIMIEIFLVFLLSVQASAGKVPPLGHVHSQVLFNSSVVLVFDASLDADCVAKQPEECLRCFIE